MMIVINYHYCIHYRFIILLLLSIYLFVITELNAKTTLKFEGSFIAKNATIGYSHFFLHLCFIINNV